MGSSGVAVRDAQSVRTRGINCAVAVYRGGQPPSICLKVTTTSSLIVEWATEVERDAQNSIARIRSCVASRDRGGPILWDC